MTIGWQTCLGIDLEVSDDFGHWLAGFIDGEGCFTIQVDRRSRAMACRLILKLRDDDTPILHEIRDVLGIGRITTEDRTSERQKGRLGADCSKWVVNKIGDVIHVIIPLFEKYPLRTKKKRDFHIWARAARLISAHAHLSTAGQEEILRLKKDMEEGRRYNGGET